MVEDNRLGIIEAGNDFEDCEQIARYFDKLRDTIADEDSRLLLIQGFEEKIADCLDNSLPNLSDTLHSFLSLSYHNNLTPSLKDLNHFLRKKQQILAQDEVERVQG